jgi:Do/DeqQ family serine protease
VLPFKQSGSRRCVLEPRPAGGWCAATLVAALFAATSALAASGEALAPSGAGDAASTTSEPTARRTPIVLAVERAAPATASITSERRVTRGASPFRVDPFFAQDPFFGQLFEQREETDQTHGTGVIFGTAGYVLTNQHVIAGAQRIWVTLSDGREFAGTLVGADPDTDLAVLKVDSKEPLPSAPLGDSQSLMIGETVIAIGNPFGLSHTVTTGVLSATNRSFRVGDAQYHGFLQTDASINPGNSGGPLLNLDGEVIGINTAIFRDAEGIGFAIPIARARRIMGDLISFGQVTPVWLGLHLQSLTPQLRATLGVSASAGAVVAQVFPDTPAARAGVRPGDVIVAFDDSPVRAPRDYFEVLRGATDGYSAPLRIERAKEIIDLSVPAEPLAAERVDALAELMLGLAVRDMTEEEVRSYGARAVVVDRGEGADPRRYRALPGDVIWAIDGERIRDLNSYRDVVRRLRGKPSTQLFVQRGRQGGSIAVRLP